MTSETPYERMLEEVLKGELRVLNAQLPARQLSLSELRKEKYPHVVSQDGNPYLFKKKELDYLVGLLNDEEQKGLFLPMLIEVHGGEGETFLICRGSVEAKVASAAIGMLLTPGSGRLRLYRPQLALLRQVLPTTTQYVFTAEITE